MKPWKYIDQVLDVLRTEGPPEGPPDDDSEVVMPISIADKPWKTGTDGGPLPPDDGTAVEPIDMG